MKRNRRWFDMPGGVKLMWDNPSTEHLILYALLAFALIIMLPTLILLQQRRINKAKEQRFYGLIDKYELSEEEEKMLVNLVERRRVSEPAHVLMHQSDYDDNVEKEMDSLMASDISNSDLQAILNMYYYIRQKIPWQT
jgi:hypothetical protein